MPAGYRVVPDKNKNTPPHTSRRQIPRGKRGFFCPANFPPQKKAPRIPFEDRRGKKRDVIRPRSLSDRLPVDHPAAEDDVTVRVNVVECMIDPEVAVTVTVESVPPPVEVVVFLLQPANIVSATATSGTSISHRPPR